MQSTVSCFKYLHLSCTQQGTLQLSHAHSPMPIWLLLLVVEYANISTLPKQQLYDLEVPTMRRGRV